LTAISGQPLQAAGLVGGAYLGSKLFTNPKFIKWLAETPKIKDMKGIERAIKRLGIIGANTPEIRDQVKQLIEERF